MVGLVCAGQGNPTKWSVLQVAAPLQGGLVILSQFDGEIVNLANRRTISGNARRIGPETELALKIKVLQMAMRILECVVHRNQKLLLNYAYTLFESSGGGR